jgi:hypothetical protein
MGAISVIWKGYTAISTAVTLAKLGVYAYILYMISAYLGGFSWATATAGLILVVL